MKEISVKARLLTWADEYPGLDEGLANLLHRLCQFADAECCAWAKVDQLAELTRKSERTVQYRMRELERLGALVPTGRRHRLAGSTRSVPIYQLAPEAPGLGAPLVQAGCMGAEVAPIEPHGCKIDGGMGATVCTRIEPKEPTYESSSELSPDAGARAGSNQGLGPALGLFEMVRTIYPASGLKRTNWTLAGDAWVEAAMEVGEVRLLSAVAAFAADPDLRKGDHGAPGLHKWLAGRAYLALLPPAGGGSLGAGAPAVRFEGPAELRAAFVAAHGEPAAVSWLDRCGWREADRTLIPATGAAAAWLGRSALAWLKEHGLRVEAGPRAEAVRERA